MEAEAAAAVKQPPRPPCGECAPAEPAHRRPMKLPASEATTDTVEGRRSRDRYHHGWGGDDGHGGSRRGHDREQCRRPAMRSRRQ